MSNLETKFIELRKKRGVILPIVEGGRLPTVSFTQNHARYTYFFFAKSVEWELFTVPYDAPEPAPYLEDLISAGIVTKDGKVNFEHGI